MLNICCSKSNSIVGTWEVQSGCGPIQINFNKDGTGSMTTPIDNQNFNWKIEGNEIVLESTLRHSSISGETHTNPKIQRYPYRLEENVLTIHYSDGTAYAFHRLN
ncbi:MAG TPA: DUF5640 domain-containing protein [Patescibacteria group bacterium]|nr:DUF5640 domain-containing protein [Patescibacteria group bacterium]